MFTSEIINALIKMQSGEPPIIPEEDDDMNTSVTSKKINPELITFPFTVNEFLRYRVFHYKRIPHFLKSYSYDKGLETIIEEDNVFVHVQPEYAKGEPVFNFFRFDIDTFEKIGFALDQSERYWKFVKRGKDNRGRSGFYAVNEGGQEEFFSSCGMSYGYSIYDDSDIISLQMIPAVKITEDMEKYIFWNISNKEEPFTKAEEEKPVITGEELYKKYIHKFEYVDFISLGILTYKEGVTLTPEENEEIAYYFGEMYENKHPDSCVTYVLFLNANGDSVETVEIDYDLWD